MSEEVRIYEAMFEGRKVRGFVSGNYFWFPDYLGKGAQKVDCLRVNDLADRHELTFHPKGEGVWIEGDVKDIHDMFAKTRAISDFGDARKLGTVQDQVWYQLEKALAQLTPSAEGGAEETPSLGELKCNCLRMEFEKHKVGCALYESTASPAKVEVELTEEWERDWQTEISIPTNVRYAKNLARVLTKFLESDESELFNESDVATLQSLRDDVNALITPAPMPEQEEPKEFGVVVEAGWNDECVVPEHRNDRFKWIRVYKLNTRVGEDDYVWQNEHGYEARSWSDLINPTRVGGAE